MYDNCFELKTLNMWSVDSGARPRHELALTSSESDAPITDATNVPWPT